MYRSASKALLEQVVCPKHKIPLTEVQRLRVGKGKAIFASPCPQCGCLYTNDSVVLGVPNGEFQIENKIIFWSGRRVRVMKNGKTKLQQVIPSIQNMPVNIIQSKNELSEFENVVPVQNWLYLSNKQLYPLKGYFAFGDNRFYCLFNSFAALLNAKELKNADLSVIRVNDPNDCLSATRPGRAFLKEKKKRDAREEQLAAKQAKAKEAFLKKQEEIIQKAFPGLYYTLPLLGEEVDQDNKRCPFCHTALKCTRAANFVLYKERKPHKSIYFIVTGCNNCNMPLATKKDLERIRRHTNGGVIKMLYATHFTKAKKAISAGQQKVSEIPVYVPPPEETGITLPFAPKTWSPEFPDLSSISQSRKVLVFAKKCMCASCRKKFNQNTIVDRTVAVFSSNGTPVKINVQFCMGCGQYFLALRSFYAYRKMYGSLNFQFVLDEDVTPEMLDWDKFAADSVLSRNGYSVKAGVSILQRQKALSYILDNHIAEKHEIITLLNQFIQLQKNRLPEACERWREDLLFVNQYRVDEQKWAGIKTLAQGGRFTQKE